MGTPPSNPSVTETLPLGEDHGTRRMLAGVERGADAVRQEAGTCRTGGDTP